MSAAVWSIVLPLLGGCAALIGGPATARLAAALSAAATSVAVLALGLEVVTSGPVRYAIGGWGAPLGIELAADGLTVAMLLTTAAIVSCIAVYAGGYYGGHRGRGQRWEPADAFWPLLLLLWAALDALFLAADLFNIYVTLELVTLAGVALVLLAQEPVARIAALRYLLAAMLGSLAYLFGVALLYAGFGTLDAAQLGERIAPGPAAWAAVALISGGLAVKSALFPLHFWLPRAHASAPAPVSAVLSALVVTASWYLFVRLWFGVFPAAITPGAAQALGTLGALGILWGSLQAIRQTSLKLMIAYSTVAQVGYLFLLLPLAGDRDAAGAADAWSGGVYLAVAHAFAKAAMFLAAGSIVQSLGRDQILGVRGIASHLPVTTYAFGIAGLTLIGLPPTGGFVAKWLMLTAAVSAGQWGWAAVILLGGVLTAGYVFQVLGQELSQAEGEERPRFAPVPRVMEHTAMVLALAGLVLGLRAVEPLALLRIGHPFAEAAAVERGR